MILLQNKPLFRGSTSLWAPEGVKFFSIGGGPVVTIGFDLVVTQYSTQGATYHQTSICLSAWI